MNTTNKTILIGPTGFLGPSFLEKDPSIIAVGRSVLPDHLSNKYFHIDGDYAFHMLDSLDFQNVIFLIGCSDHHKLNNDPTLAIEKREYSKLIVTKSIDQIFENLKKLANEINIDFKKFEHLDIDIIIKSFHNLEQEKLKDIISNNINTNQISYKFSQSILIPDVIDSSKNFNYFYNINCKENYKTKKTSIGEIIELNKLSDFKKISNKIVLIENADPGFDFLFSYKIKGLITKYGGSNAHVAIRCMELGLPAIIGVGDKTYNHFSNSKKVFIDCNNKNYSIIH